MRIELPNNYYIILDTNGNYTLYQKTTVKSGKTKGDNLNGVIGYFSSIPSAVNRYILHNLSNTEDMVDLKEYMNRYEKLKNEVIETLSAKGVELK